MSVFQNSKADFDILCYNVNVTSPSILSKILKTCIKKKCYIIYYIIYKLCKDIEIT